MQFLHKRNSYADVKSQLYKHSLKKKQLLPLCKRWVCGPCEELHRPRSLCRNYAEVAVLRNWTFELYPYDSHFGITSSEVFWDLCISGIVMQKFRLSQKHLCRKFVINPIKGQWKKGTRAVCSRDEKICLRPPPLIYEKSRNKPETCINPCGKRFNGTFVESLRSVGDVAGTLLAKKFLAPVLPVFATALNIKL